MEVHDRVPILLASREGPYPALQSEDSEPARWMARVVPTDWSGAAVNPSPDQLVVLEWFSSRNAIRWATVPLHWKPIVRRLVNGDWPHGERWLERHDTVLLRITPTGRMLAAAFRHGRASVAPGQLRLIEASDMHLPNETRTEEQS